MKKLFLTCAVFAVLGPNAVLAETVPTEPVPAVTEGGGYTVTEKVVVQQKELPNYNKINFMDFDLDGDGVLSRDEVGEKLFRLFDRDGNQVIDNIEMKTIGVLSFIPMEKETIEIVSYNNPDAEDKVTVSQEEFLEASSLNKFDKDDDGLTPLDFIGKPFNQIDVKGDKVIDLEEWKRAYAALVRPLHQEQFFYNN